MRFSLKPRSLIFLMAVVAVSFMPGRSSAAIVLNELLAAPARDWNGDGEVDYKNDEWVEILNTGNLTVDLTGLYLKDATGDAYHYGFTGSLAPGETMVVYGSDAVAWQAANDAGSSGLSINNGDEMLELWRDIPDPRVLQVVDFVPIPAHAGASDRAMGRLPDSLDWVLFDSLNPYSGDLLPAGTGCVPSPGVPNSCDAVGVEDLSFGRIKVSHGMRN